MNPPSLLTVPERLLPGILGGYPSLDLGELDPHFSAIAGQEWPIPTGHSNARYCGIADPEQKCLWIYATETLQDPSFWQRTVQKACQLRKRLQLQENNCYRLIHSEGDGLPGFQVDIYNRYAVLYLASKALWPYGRFLAQAIWEEVSLEGLVLTLREGNQSAQRPPHEVFRGHVPSVIEVQEEGITYEIHLLTGLNPGLFLDMRLNRLKLRAWVAQRKVLNLFSYTGSFSVVAAKFGASEVVSVDRTQGVLNWSQTNFKKNQIDIPNSAYSFVCEDVFTYLEETSARFQFVILDPPSWSTHGKQPFYLKTHLGDLLQKTLAVIENGGWLWLHINSHQSRPESLEKQIRSAAQQQQVQLQLLESSGLSSDFPTQMIYPQGRYLKSWLFQIQTNAKS